MKESGLGSDEPGGPPSAGGDFRGRIVKLHFSCIFLYRAFNGM